MEVVKIDRSLINCRVAVFSFPFEDWAFVFFFPSCKRLYRIAFRNWHAAYNRERIKEYIDAHLILGLGTWLTLNQLPQVRVLRTLPVPHRDEEAVVYLFYNPQYKSLNTLGLCACITVEEKH
jgi:hypothetical protein